mmetsp:Transcript_1737/g.3268  ORF Transcript_1737/g.3268 Transcript_1737/m.3268 type:complete len:82 (-) Transcript_1737:90-335(-)
MCGLHGWPGSVLRIPELHQPVHLGPDSQLQRMREGQVPAKILCLQWFGWCRRPLSKSVWSLGLDLWFPRKPVLDKASCPPA